MSGMFKPKAPKPAPTEDAAKAEREAKEKEAEERARREAAARQGRRALAGSSTGVETVYSGSKVSLF